MRRRNQTSWTIKRFRFVRNYRKSFSEGIASALDLAGKTAQGELISTQISAVEAMQQDSLRIGADMTNAVGQFADE